MSHTKRIEEFNHDLLKFPPLMWVCAYKNKYVLSVWWNLCVSSLLYQVVQDFVQATVEADSPREWLLSLMDTSSRESEYDINLLGQL